MKIVICFLSLLAHFGRFCHIYFAINWWCWRYSLNGLFLFFLVLRKHALHQVLEWFYPNLSRINFPSIEHAMLKVSKNKQFFDKTVFFVLNTPCHIPHSSRSKRGEFATVDPKQQGNLTHGGHPFEKHILNVLPEATETMAYLHYPLYAFSTTTPPPAPLHGLFVHPTHSQFHPQYDPWKSDLSYSTICESVNLN